MGLARKGAIIALARLGSTSTEDHCPGALASYSIERDGTGQMVVGPYHYRNSAIKDVEPSLFTAVVWEWSPLNKVRPANTRPERRV